MQNEMKDILRLEGISVILEEIQPIYFPYVIKWRNDKELNKFLNQPVDLTMESQTKWYEEMYLRDNTQGFMIIIDKKCHIPFATLGWTDMDLEKKRCIMGRLILGDSRFSNSASFLESFFILADYLYKMVDVIYSHVEIENKKALRLNKMLGFCANDGQVQYPDELFVNGDKARRQVEIYRTKEMYESVRRKMYREEFFF